MRNFDSVMPEFGKSWKIPHWFTLAELIVVVAILAILATIGFVSMSGYSTDAKNSVRLADVNSLTKVAEIAYAVQWKYPEPANSVSVTGWTLWSVIFKQWIANSTVFRELSWKFGWSTGSWAYAYSTLADGSAYQVAAEYEWTPPFALWANVAYAATKSAYVQGSYVPNPAMPGLVVVPWSVPSSASGGLWSPDVCFITNGGTNLPSSASDSCVKRAALEFWKSDPNLIAYYDMETYYQASYSWVANTLFLKDMSGNGYDMPGRIGPTSSPSAMTSTIAPGGSVFDVSSNDAGVKFMSGTYQLGFWTIDSDFSGTTPYAKPVPRSQFFTEMTSSWSKIIPWLSFESRVSYDRTSAAGWGIKRSVTWSVTNFNAIDAGDAYKTIDSSPLRMNGSSLHSYIVPYNIGTVGTPYWVNGYVGCNGICSSEWSHNYWSTSASFSGELLLDSVFDFTKKTNCTYVNGSKVSCVNLSQSTIARLQDAGYKKANLSLSSVSEPWSGTIRSASFYSRAMSEQEIAQHARVSGF